MKSNFKLIVFDCDGTLVDSLDGIVRSAQLALAEMGHEQILRPSDVAEVVGLSLVQAFEILLPGATSRENTEAVALYRKHYKHLADAGQLSTPLYPGVRETLQRLQAAGLVMAVATGKSLKGLERNLQELDLGAYFSCLRTADHAPSKPNPEMLFQVLAETGFTPQEALMVGDTEFDLNMGRGAGVKTCAVTFGCHSRQRLALCQPDFWLDRMSDLPLQLGLK
ncbi:MAG: HAD-IA family hydrolase [Magnetococcales bacterium]|nr:HAD-IA family hydrolase [Magnetococcales bacterium]